MADVPFVTFAFPLSSAIATATTTRTMPTRLSDVVNVLDYGADPNFSGDSTAAFQAACDAAFGSTGTGGFHGVTNAWKNRAVFIPNGNYKMYSGPVVLNQVYGGHIFGAGRDSVLLDGGDGATLWRTNGMSNSLMESFSTYTKSPGAGIGGAGSGIDLNWDNSNTSADTSAGVSVGLHGNVFKDLHITGGTYGIKIAGGGFDGANNVIFACFITQVIGLSQNGGGGVATLAAAAVNNAIIGGNISSSTIGAHAVLGGFSCIQGWSAQNFGNFGTVADGVDVQLEATSTGPTVISGCRCEGPTFLRALSLDQPVVVNACNSTGAAPHTPLNFIEAHGPCIMEGCNVDECRVMAREAARFTIRTCRFFLLGSPPTYTTTTWLDTPASSLWFTPTNLYSAVIEIENVLLGQPSAVATSIAKERRYTTNGTSITTKTYTVV